MIIRGFDTATNTMRQARALSNDGMRFCGRYLTRADDWRTLHLPEVERLHEVGIAVVCIFQHRANTPDYFIAENGEIDANMAIKRAAAMHLPGMCAIYFAVDHDIVPATIEKVLVYFRAVAGRMRKTGWLVGIYGDDRALEAVMGADLADFGYFANAKGWRENAVADDYDILQKPERCHPAGIEIDDCEIAMTDGESGRDVLRAVGAWLPDHASQEAAS